MTAVAEKIQEAPVPAEAEKLEYTDVVAMAEDIKHISDIHALLQKGKYEGREASVLARSFAFLEREHKALFAKIKSHPEADRVLAVQAPQR